MYFCTIANLYNGAMVNNYANIYLHVSSLQAILADSLMTINTQSTDQSEAQQLTTTTIHEQFKPLIAPSLCDPLVSRCQISDCIISRNRCEISDEVTVLIWNFL